MTIWALLFLVLGPNPFTGHPVDAPSCTNFKPKCWFVLNSPSGITNFNIPIDIGKTVTGVVSINGMLNTTPLSRTEFDVLKLLKFQNPSGYSDVIMQLELQVRKTERVGNEHEHTLDVRGVLVDSGTGGIPRLVYYPGERNLRDYVVDPEAEKNGTYWIFRGGRIRIQISDLEATKVHAYKFFFGDPGNAVEYHFNYGSEENWQQFDHLRLNATRVVANEDEKLLVAYHNITVCSDATPVLCEPENEIIKVTNLGEAVTLECSGFGAPYLTLRWEDENGTALDGYLEQVLNRGADSFIRSTYVVKHFNVDHIGKYYCSIHNENFKISSTKSFELEYSQNIFIIRSPERVFSTRMNGTSKLYWIIEGWPLENVSLVCHDLPQFGLDYRKEIFPDYGHVPRLVLTLPLDPETVPDKFSCYVVDGISVLERRSFKKEMVPNCDPGEVPVGKACYDIGSYRLKPIHILVVVVVLIIIVIASVALGVYLKTKFPGCTDRLLSCSCQNESETTTAQGTNKQVRFTVHKVSSHDDLKCVCDDDSDTADTESHNNTVQSVQSGRSYRSIRSFLF